MAPDVNVCIHNGIFINTEGVHEASLVGLYATGEVEVEEGWVVLAWRAALEVTHNVHEDSTVDWIGGQHKHT